MKKGARIRSLQKGDILKLKKIDLETWNPEGCISLVAALWTGCSSGWPELNWSGI